jgi:hypothetical protein
MYRIHGRPIIQPAAFPKKTWNLEGDHKTEHAVPDYQE